MRGRAVAGVVLALGLAVMATAVANATPPTGHYAGTTTEKGTVSFRVTAHAVLSFTVADGYNGACHFSGGVGGIKTFTIVIGSMALSKTGHFTAHLDETNSPFPGNTTIVVTGRFTGAKAFGTVTAVGKVCGTGSPTPSASIYYESYSATRG